MGRISFIHGSINGPLGNSTGIATQILVAQFEEKIEFCRRFLFLYRAGANLSLGAWKCLWVYYRYQIVFPSLATVRLCVNEKKSPKEQLNLHKWNQLIFKPCTIQKSESIFLSPQWKNYLNAAQFEGINWKTKFESSGNHCHVCE